MDKLVLSRLWMSETLPTLGVLLLNSKPFCYTLEKPWKDNQRNISCIPTGQYTCVKRMARLEGNAVPFETFEVKDVPDRTGILFHVGNYVKDSSGCILLGSQVSSLDRISISNSNMAYKRFMEAVSGDVCELLVCCSVRLP